MITVPEAVGKIVGRSRYLAEAMSKGIINNSSLARYIKPEIEEILIKKVSDSAIIMALNRLSKKIKPKYSTKNIFKAPPDMILRSNLMLVNLRNSKELEGKSQAILRFADEGNFLTITKGGFDTTIIASTSLKKEIRKILEDRRSIKQFEKLSAITIRLPKGAATTPGIFYFFLKSLAWEGINIIEVVSTNQELTLIVNEKDTNRTFSILRSLFSRII